jgi:hypothetical protein
MFNGGNKRVQAKPSDVRENYNPSHFDRRILNEKPDTVPGHLHNLQVQAEVARLDMNERLDTLIEIQRELLETQKAVLDELRRPQR